MEPKIQKTIDRQVSNTSLWWAKIQQENLWNENPLPKNLQLSMVPAKCQAISLHSVCPWLSWASISFHSFECGTALPADILNPDCALNTRHVYPYSVILKFPFLLSILMVENTDFFILTIMNFSHLVCLFCLFVKMYLFSHSIQSTNRARLCK